MNTDTFVTLPVPAFGAMTLTQKIQGNFITFFIIILCNGFPLCSKDGYQPNHVSPFDAEDVVIGVS